MNKIVKKFNNLVKKTIFKVQNKTNNNFRISNFNKYLITFIGLIFFYLFYLLIPLLYEKSWIQSNIESKLLNDFKINISTSANISYRILPAPHFLVKDSKILVDVDEKQKSIGEIKNLKVFLSQSNFFNKEKMNLKKVVINDANFSLLINDLKLFNKIRNKNFSNKKIKINNSNIFLKDNLGEIISIIKIDKTIFFYDDKKLLNFLNLRGEAFNVPFTLDWMNRNDTTKYEEINFRAKSLKLNIFNKSTIKKDNSNTGENVISFLNSAINTKYNVKEKLIIFTSGYSKVNNSKINYRGELSINPFDLDLIISIDNHKISKLFNINPILTEFIKSKLLFNENISVNTSLVVNSNSKNQIFQNAKINLQAIDGKINFDNTRFVNDKIGSLELRNSNFFFENNNLILNTDILINIEDSNHLFSFLNTSKSSRKNLKNVLINLDYNFLSNQIKFNKIKIDNNKVSDQFLNVIEDFKNNNLNNLNKSRRLINELLNAYAG